ncbi:XK-related protein 8 isoform 2-T2 [Alca torda]
MAPRFGPLQLGLAAAGTAAAVLDVCVDGWVAAEYAWGGQPGLAALVLALLAIASVATQACSWLWLRSDPPALRPDVPQWLVAVLHLLQLGFLFRCLHALRVGWKLCWEKAEEKEEQEQSRMAFLSHDISMLRLFETFLENTPQLTLLLYVILQTDKAEPSQGQVRAELALLHRLLPVEPLPHLPPHPRGRPLCPALALQRGCPLPTRVAGHVPLGQSPGHGLHGVAWPRAALPRHGGRDPLLQLVQRGTGKDAVPQHHLSRLHPGGQHAAGPVLALVPVPLRGALVPHPAGLCRAALLPAGAGTESCLLQVAAPQPADAARRWLRRGGCQRED